MIVGICRLRREAEAELDGYVYYIVKDNQVAIGHQETFQMLADMPLMATPYQTLRGELPPIRFAPIKDYPHHLIYYRPGNSFIGTYPLKGPGQIVHNRRICR